MIIKPVKKGKTWWHVRVKRWNENSYYDGIYYIMISEYPDLKINESFELDKECKITSGYGKDTIISKIKTHDLRYLILPKSNEVIEITARSRKHCYACKYMINPPKKLKDTFSWYCKIFKKPIIRNEDSGGWARLGICIENSFDK